MNEKRGMVDIGALEAEIMDLKSRLTERENLLIELWNITKKHQEQVGDCDSSVAYELFRDAINEYTVLIDPCNWCALGIDGICVSADAFGG